LEYPNHDSVLPIATASFDSKVYVAKLGQQMGQNNSVEIFSRRIVK